MKTRSDATETQFEKGEHRVAEITPILSPETSQLYFPKSSVDPHPGSSGRRYYATVPPADTALFCERQPDNPHDADAIAVYVPGGGQAGICRATTPLTSHRWLIAVSCVWKRGWRAGRSRQPHTNQAGGLGR